MRFVRSCVSGAFFACFALGSVLLGFLLFPLLAVFGDSAAVRRRMRGLVRLTYRLFVWAARVTGLFRVEISDADRVRLAALRGCVVVSNHLTLIDIVILISCLGDATAVAKSTAARNPFYSRIVKSVFLVTDDPENILEQAACLLAGGTNLIVFPEGTRTLPDAPNRRLKRGAAQMALSAGAPVQAVTIACDPLVLAKNQSWYDVGDRTIVYTVCLKDRIDADSSSGRSHASAVALTERIGRILFPACKPTAA